MPTTITTASHPTLMAAVDFIRSDCGAFHIYSEISPGTLTDIPDYWDRGLLNGMELFLSTLSVLPTPPPEILTDPDYDPHQSFGDEGHHAFAKDYYTERGAFILSEDSTNAALTRRLNAQRQDRWASVTSAFLSDAFEDFPNRDAIFTDFDPEHYREEEFAPRGDEVAWHAPIKLESASPPDNTNNRLGIPD